jgi:hypothetical protein
MWFCQCHNQLGNYFDVTYQNTRGLTIKLLVLYGNVCSADCTVLYVICLTGTWLNDFAMITM